MRPPSNGDGVAGERDGGRLPRRLRVEISPDTGGLLRGVGIIAGHGREEDGPIVEALLEIGLRAIDAVGQLGRDGPGVVLVGILVGIPGRQHRRWPPLDVALAVALGRPQIMHGRKADANARFLCHHHHTEPPDAVLGQALRHELLKHARQDPPPRR